MITKTIFDVTVNPFNRSANIKVIAYELYDNDKYGFTESYTTIAGFYMYYATIGGSETSFAIVDDWNKFEVCGIKYKINFYYDEEFNVFITKEDDDENLKVNLTIKLNAYE